MNKKYRLAPNGAMKTRHEATEFIVEPFFLLSFSNVSPKFFLY